MSFELTTSPASRPLIGLVVLGGLVMAALVVGWATTVVDPVLVVAGAIAVAGGLLFAFRPLWLFWYTILVGLVVAGLAKLYAPPIELIRWTLTPVSLLLMLYAGAAWFGKARDYGPRYVPPQAWWAGAFVLAVLLSTVAGDLVFDRFSVGLKGYFQVWLFFFALVFYPWPRDLMDRLPLVLLGLAFLQLPFVLHQFLFIVPQRVGMGDGIVPVDVVAGTFGAKFAGGGANALMNAFLVIVMAGIVAAFQARAISGPKALLLALPLLLPILVNMAKVSVVYFALAYLVLFGADIIRRPLRFIATSLAAAGLLVLILFAYAQSAPPSAGVNSIKDLIVYTYETNTGRVQIGGQDQLSRAGSIGFWAERHGLNDLRRTLFGHGAGFTRVGDEVTPTAETVRSELLGVTENIDLESRIGRTAIAALLWEVGVVGLVSVLGLIIATFIAATRLERRYADVPIRFAALRAARVAMLLMFVTMWHKNAIVLDVTYQVLFLLIMGYVAYWARQAREPGPGPVRKGANERDYKDFKESADQRTLRTNGL